MWMRTTRKAGSATGARHAVEDGCWDLWPTPLLLLSPLLLLRVGMLGDSAAAPELRGTCIRPGCSCGEPPFPSPAPCAAGVLQCAGAHRPCRCSCLGVRRPHRRSTGPGAAWLGCGRTAAADGAECSLPGILCLLLRRHLELGAGAAKVMACGQVSGADDLVTSRSLHSRSAVPAQLGATLPFTLSSLHMQPRRAPPDYHRSPSAQGHQRRRHAAGFWRRTGGGAVHGPHILAGQPDQVGAGVGLRMRGLWAVGCVGCGVLLRRREMLRRPDRLAAFSGCCMPHAALQAASKRG